MSDFIDGCSSLEELDLSHNNLRKVTPAIGDMHALRNLNLSHNQSLRSLKGCLTQLYNLHTLNIEHTDVRSIPNDIRRCTSLKHLNATQTSVRSIPDVFDGTPHLRSFKLETAICKLVLSLCQRARVYEI